MEITKATLEKLYIQDKKSCKEIGLFFEKSTTQISRLLKKFSIPARSFSTKGISIGKGRHLSDETKLKLSLAKRGKKLSPEHREKIIRNTPRMFGSDNHAWKGGRIITDEGYIAVKMRNHPAVKNGYVKEHRLVMENHLNRLLLPCEVVHHINGIKTDNRIENLELMTHNEHGTKHWENEEKRHARAEFIREIRKKRFWSTKKLFSSSFVPSKVVER